MKVVLAFPCQKKYLADPSISILPLGLLSMAAVLEAGGHEPVVIHLARYSAKDGQRLIESYRPDVVGLSMFTFQRHRCLALAERLKRSGVPFIVLGGPHAAVVAGELLDRCPYVDAVVTGDGETAMPALVDTLEKGLPPGECRHPDLMVRGGREEPAFVRTRTAGEGAKELDSLPSFPWGRIPVLGVDTCFQKRHVLASRGCRARCVFCCAPVLGGGTVSRHGVERVVRDIVRLRDEHGVVHVGFRDDSLASDRQWLLDLCEALSGIDILWDCQSRFDTLDAECIDAMVKAGCIQVQLGLESASDEMLTALRKPFRMKQASRVVEWCRAAALPMSFYLVCGVPGERKEHIDATVDFVRGAGPAGISLSRLALYPGTALAEGIPPAEWFERDDESIFARDDRAALDHERRLTALAGAMAATEPYGEGEFRTAGDRLGWPPSLRIGLARLLLRKGDPHGAARELERLLDVRPDHPWGLFEAACIMLDQGGFEAAGTMLERLVRLVPRWSYAVDRLGWCLVGQGKADRGEKLIAEAAALDPFAQMPGPPSLLRGGRGRTGRGGSRRRQGR